MASFLKNLFEKRKDKKYGKGHKLGDSNTAQQAASYQERHEEYTENVNRIEPACQSEASKRAGEAAINRLNTRNTRPTSSNKSQLIQEKSNTIKENELQKVLMLKEHYFGLQKVSQHVASPIVSKNNIRFKSSLLGANDSYCKDELEDLIEQTLLSQLEDEPILVAVTLLFTANYKNQDKLNKCVEILNKFIDNILNSPGEEKYRKIRLENAIFKEKVYSCKYADMVLKKGGFKATTIKKEESNQDGSVITEVNEAFFVYDGDDLEQLKNLKEALGLGEPIIPTLDRDLRVYKISTKSSITNFDLSDEFYNLNVEELRKEHKLKMEAVEAQGMLKTKAMRERDEQLELRRYNYCLVRIRFPDDHILQALFKSQETYEDLYKFIQECLEYDSIPFELFGHSLKKSITLASTLAEAGLAPAALINFKWNEGSLAEATQLNINLKHYIKTELLKNALDL